MTAMTCGRPGCAGVIEDGYCTVCGLAPAPGTAGPSAGSPQRAAAGPATAGLTTAAVSTPTLSGAGSLAPEDRPSGGGHASGSLIAGSGRGSRGGPVAGRRSGRAGAG